jgi:hypothetical protein
MLEKVDNVIDRIGAVRRSTLLQKDTADALTALAERFHAHRKQLLDFIKQPTDPAVVANHCDIVLLDLFRYLPYIGFLHRARHPSNPFEVHGPLKRLATQVIGSDVRLIISSEWDFSPYTHPTMGDISDFVLLGLPASESENALLVPIAGHEFGHPVWKREKLEAKIAPIVDRAVLDQLRARLDVVKMKLGISSETELQTDPRVIAVRANLAAYARGQAQEIFCDLLGLLLFGESYCHAFAHLLAPGLIAYQSRGYPTARRRAEILRQSAERLGVTVPAGFDDLFQVPPVSEWSVEVTAAVVDDLVDGLLSEVEAFRDSRALKPPSEEGRLAARNFLENATPASPASTLTELLCAAWDLRTKEDLWSSKPYLREIRDQLLNDLVLKSAQALDYWHLVGATP